jgi:hypothetical protein
MTRCELVVLNTVEEFGSSAASLDIPRQVVPIKLRHLLHRLRVGHVVCREIDRTRRLWAQKILIYPMRGDC